jgi:predicted nucleic acid-binding Zn ribbon protein
VNDKIDPMRPLSSALPGALAELLREAPLSPGKVAFAWRAAVGPAIERETSVRLEGTTLMVDAASRQWAREVRRSSGIIMQRLGALLGAEVVTGLSIRERKT